MKNLRGTAAVVAPTPPVGYARTRPARLRRLRPGSIVTFIFGIALVAAAVAPIVEVIRTVAAGSEGFLDVIVETVTTPSVQQAFLGTLVLGTTAAIFTTTIAVSLAWLIYRTDLPGRRVFRTLVIVPFFVPVLVTAVAWSLLTGSNAGLLNRFLDALGIDYTINLFNLPGIAFVICIALVPIAFVFVRSAVSEPDTEQEEAAMVSGASKTRITFGITLPRIVPSIGATALFVFVLAAGNFSVTGVLGTPWRVNVLTTEIYVAMNSPAPNYGHVAVVALLLLAILMVLLFFQFRLERRARTVDARGAGREAITWKLGPWRWVGFAVVLLYLLVALVLPIGATVVATLLPYWGAPFDSFGLDNFSRLFSGGSIFGEAIQNTLVLATVGASVAAIVGCLAAYAFRRLRPPGSMVFDAVASSSFALPGIVVGLGYLLLSAATPVYGTLPLMIFVVTVLLLPLALRLISSGLTRVSISLDESARVLGAREVRVFWDIVRPQITPALLSGWILLFLMFSHEVDAIIMVSGPGSAVISTQIYEQYSNGDPALAASGSLVLLLITIVALGLLGLVIAAVGRRRGRMDLL